MRRDVVCWIVCVMLIVAAFGTAAYFHAQLPDRIPTHWNIKGEVDGYGPRSTVFLMPGVMVFLLGLFAVLRPLSPKPFAVELFRSTYLIVMTITIAMMGYLHGAILYATFHPDAPIGRALVGGIMFFLAAIGNFMGKIRRNLYMGIRTPWTLASDRVWADTHRVGAWWLAGGGVLGGILCLTPLPVWAALVPLAPAIVVPIAYSYLHYKRLEKLGELGHAAEAGGVG